MKCTQDKLLIF